MTNVNGSKAENGSYSLASIYTRSTEDVTNDHNLERLNYDKLVQSDDEELISNERFDNDELLSDYESEYEKQPSRGENQLKPSNKKESVNRKQNDDLKHFNIERYDRNRHKIVKELKGKSGRRERYGKGISFYREVSPETQKKLTNADLLEIRNKTKNYEEIDKKFCDEQFGKSNYKRDETIENNSSIGSQDENVSDGEQAKGETISEFQYIKQSTKRENKNKNKKRKEQILLHDTNTAASDEEQDKEGTISEFEYIQKLARREKKNKEKKRKEKILLHDTNTAASDGEQVKEGTISEFEYIQKLAQREKKNKKRKEQILLHDTNTAASLKNITRDDTKQKHYTGDTTISYDTKKTHGNAKQPEQSMTSSGKSESNNVISPNMHIYDDDFDQVVNKESFELIKRFVEKNEKEKPSNSYLDDYYEEPLPSHLIGKQDYVNRGNKENQPKQVESGFGLRKENTTPLRKDNNVLDNQGRESIPEGNTNPQNKLKDLPKNKDSLENKQKNILSIDSNKKTSSKENQLKQLEPGFGLWKENRTPLRRDNNLLEKQEKQRIPKGDSKENNKPENLAQNKDSSRKHLSKNKLPTESNNNFNKSNSTEPMSFDIHSFRDYITKEIEKSRSDLPCKDDTSTQGKNKSDKNNPKIKHKLSKPRGVSAGQDESIVSHNRTSTLKNKFSQPSTNEGSQSMALNKGKSTYRSKSDLHDDQIMPQNKNYKSNNKFSYALSNKGLQGATFDKDISDYKSTSGRQNDRIMSKNKNDKSNNKFSNPPIYKGLKGETLDDDRPEFKSTSGRQDRIRPQSKNYKLKMPPPHKGLKGISLDRNQDKKFSNEPEENDLNNNNVKTEESEPHYKQFYNKNKRQEKILKKLGNPKLKMVERVKWDDKMNNSPQKTYKKRVKMATHVTYTHTQGKTCENESECIDIVRNLHKWNLESGKPDIHYNFLVGGDAAIYEGSGWPKFNIESEPSGFDIRYKGVAPISGSSSISIAFMGRYLDERPPPHMLNAAYVFVEDSMDKKYINRNFTYSRLV